MARVEPYVREREMTERIYIVAVYLIAALVLYFDLFVWRVV